MLAVHPNRYLQHNPQVADGIEGPWPGHLVGGANPTELDWHDETEDPRTNENAINWDASLVYALAALNEKLDALRIPVGLDLGSTTHKEMAVAILAELVQRRAAGEFAPPVDIDTPQVATAIDPICGMTVDAVDTSHPLDIGDETYYFCCPGCRAAFESQQGA